VTPTPSPTASGGLSGLSVGLLAAGAAIVASLITGGIAYAGIRHQLKHDREMRLMEARRVAYGHLLGVAFDTVTYLSLQGVPWRAETYRRLITGLTSRITVAVSDVRLVATEPVTRAAEVLMDAIQQAVGFATKAIGEASDRPRIARLLRPHYTPVVSATGYQHVLARLGEDATTFIDAAKAELGFPPVPRLPDSKGS